MLNGDYNVESTILFVGSNSKIIAQLLFQIT